MTDMTEWLAMIDRLRADPRWQEIVQTHISIVLLGRETVLKLKKPVDFGFLDYTTLEKRRAACEAEVALNSRLCPEAYIGVEPVREKNEIVDYGVAMRRLPADRMLDRLVADGLATESIVERIADRLAAFHRDARRGPDVDRFGSLAELTHNWEENFEQTEPFAGRTITREAFDEIRAWARAWLEAHGDLVARRIADRHVCDGHGDVRCESVCVTESICIFDCIEFNDRFRCGDVASEVAFLGMDLAARGRPDLAYRFAERYAEASGDDGIFALLPFYHAYRAFVRGKVLGFQLDEPEIGDKARERAAEAARRYFDLAVAYVGRPSRAGVVLVAGLSGTGKTSVARGIAHMLGLRVVSSDAVRKSLLAPTAEDREYGGGIYSATASERTYAAMLERAERLMASDGGVVLDATFRRRDDRERARLLGATRTIECVLDEEEVRERLARRSASGEGLSDATWETYARQRAEMEPILEGEGEHLRLYTSGPIERVVATAMAGLR